MAKQLPKYSKIEELCNIYSHAVAWFFFAIASIFLIRKAIILHNAVQIVAVFVYSISLLVLYGISSLYHGSVVYDERRKWQKADHLSVSILICGSNTIFLMGALQSRIGYILTAVNFALFVISAIINIIDVDKFRTPSMIIYIISGWMSAVVIKYIYVALTAAGTVLLIIGGLFYTFGLTFYGIKKKYFHFVWHLFVFGGSIMHFFCAYYFVVL